MLRIVNFQGNLVNSYICWRDFSTDGRQHKSRL